MIWLDNIVALPTVGCSFKPTFKPAQAQLDAMRPLLEDWAKTTDLQITADKPMSFVIGRNDGFTYTVDVDKISVTFQYNFELKNPPGRVPELSYTVDVQKYSALISSAVENFCTFFDHVVGLESRSMIRAGIVARCRLDGEALPPGVKMFMDHLARPWGTRLSKYQTHLLAELSHDEAVKDQCHHQLNADDDRKNDVSLTLDWQRVFLKNVEVRRGKSLRENIEKCRNSAFEYFDRFAKGDLDYGNADAK